MAGSDPRDKPGDFGPAMTMKRMAYTRFIYSVPNRPRGRNISTAR